MPGRGNDQAVSRVCMEYPGETYAVNGYGRFNRRKPDARQGKNRIKPGTCFLSKTQAAFL